MKTTLINMPRRLKKSLIKQPILGLLIFGSFAFFQACKEPTYPIEDAEQYTNVFMQLASDGPVEKSFSIQDEWAKISFGAGYGGFDILNQPLKVDFTIDPSLIEQYNQQNNTQYTLPPEGSYKMAESSVQIQPGNAGSNSTSLEINPVLLGGTKQYIIPVKIDQVQPAVPIAQNLQATYFLVNGFYETNPFEPISNAAWSIADYSDDDYDGIGGRAPFCIDSDVNTCWLSTYRRVDGWRPGHPHFVAIDMKDTHTMHGVTLFGRRGANQAYLFPKNVLIQTSSDGETWEDAGSYTIAASSDDTSATMYFEQSVSCRYFKVTVLSSEGNGDTTAVAELVAF